VLLSSGDSFPHLIQKHSSPLGFVTYLLNYPLTMNLWFITCLNSICLSCTHISLQGMLPRQCLWLGGLAYWVWTQPKVWSIVSATFRSHEVSCIHYLRTRYEKRIVDPLCLLAFIVLWSRKKSTRFVVFMIASVKMRRQLNNELCLWNISCYFGYTERWDDFTEASYCI
jgi:hypothetical protein